MRYSAEHKEETRRRILNAAGQLFRQEGYGGSGIDSLTRAAGVTNGAFYGHFASKRDLYLACLDEAWASFRAGSERAIAADPLKCLGAVADTYMSKGKKIRLIDLWIQALTVSAEDKVIAAALRRQVREVHDFFAEVIRDGQERGALHADRDPEAEAWIFVAGGLLATMDSRLGGLLGDDLQRVRAERHRWMAADASV